MLNKVEEKINIMENKKNKELKELETLLKRQLENEYDGL